MATSSAVVARRPQSRFKYALFSLLGLMFLFVLWNNERFIIDHSHPDWTYYFPVRYLLIPHGLGGLMALLIGPLQLSSRFRTKHVRVHRMSCRLFEGFTCVHRVDRKGERTIPDRALAIKRLQRPHAADVASVQCRGTKRLCSQQDAREVPRRTVPRA